MTDPVDDDPEYADEKVAHVDLPPLTDPTTVPPDETDEADQ